MAVFVRGTPAKSHEVMQHPRNHITVTSNLCMLTWFLHMPHGSTPYGLMCHPQRSTKLYTPSHITSLIIVSDLVPASLLLGLNHSEPNTGINPFPSSHLNMGKSGICFNAHISITRHHLGDVRDTAATSTHPINTRTSSPTVDQHALQSRLMLRSSSPTMSRLFHSFLTLSLRFFW